MNFKYLVAVVIVIAWIFAKKRKDKKSECKENIHDLTKACMNDKDLVNRLIQHEIYREPKIKRDEAARRAYERLKRDRK